MECYNTRCKEECNNFKMMYCFKKVTEEQNKVISELKRVKTCSICGHQTVVAKHITRKDRYRRINLCTNCKKEEKIA